jgi:hypothetical protein
MGLIHGENQRPKMLTLLALYVTLYLVFDDFVNNVMIKFDNKIMHIIKSHNFLTAKSTLKTSN